MRVRSFSTANDSFQQNRLFVRRDPALSPKVTECYFAKFQNLRASEHVATSETTAVPMPVSDCDRMWTTTARNEPRSELLAILATNGPMTATELESHKKEE